MKTLHILYVPGLGDRYGPMRRFFLSFWQLYGVTTELVPMNWSDGHSFEEKFTRLSMAIDRAGKRNVALLGESAGGSMVLHMYAARPNRIFKAVTICGKNTNPHNVSSLTYRKNPAFETSMRSVDATTARLNVKQRRAFISVYPLTDSVVPVQDTLIPDCQTKRLWSIGHIFSIFCALSIASPYIIRIIKR